MIVHSIVAHVVANLGNPTRKLYQTRIVTQWEKARTVFGRVTPHCLDIVERSMAQPFSQIFKTAHTSPLADLPIAP